LVAIGPVRSTDVALLDRRYRALVDTDLGGVIILRGRRGTGRTFLLRTAAVRLRFANPRPLLLAGSLVSGLDGRDRYEPWDVGRDEKNPGLTVLTDSLSLAGFVFPTAAFVGQLITTSSDAARLARALSQDELRDNPLTHLPRLLRDASMSRPCVCLIDDADLCPGLWRDLELTLAREIRDGLRVLLVLAVSDPQEEYVASSREAAAFADHLIARGLAEMLTMKPFTASEISEWIGPADREISSDLVALTWGRASLIADVWADWRRYGTVSRLSPSEPWGYTGAADTVGVATADDALRAHMKAITDNLDPGTFSQLREILSCAAC